MIIDIKLSVKLETFLGMKYEQDINTARLQSSDRRNVNTGLTPLKFTLKVRQAFKNTMNG